MLFRGTPIRLSLNESVARRARKSAEVSRGSQVPTATTTDFSDSLKLSPPSGHSRVGLCMMESTAKRKPRNEVGVVCKDQGIVHRE